MAGALAVASVWFGKGRARDMSLKRLRAFCVRRARRRPTGVVAALLRLRDAVPGAWICRKADEAYVRKDEYRECPTLMRLMGYPTDDLVDAMLDVDAKTVGAKQFPTVLGRYGLVIGKKYHHGTVPGSGYMVFYYRLPGDGPYSTPADQMAVAFDATFPPDLLARVRSGAQVMVPTPAPSPRVRGVPSEVLCRILDSGGRPVTDPLHDDELFALGAFYQRHRRLVEQLQVLDISARHLRGAARRPLSFPQRRYPRTRRSLTRSRPGRGVQGGV